MDLPTPNARSDDAASALTPPLHAQAARESSAATLTAAGSPRRGVRKRSHASANEGDTGLGSPGSEDVAVAARNRRRGHKVSRACDHCKQRKAKCSGTLPCTKCASKNIECLYDATYSRGRPPTPPPSRDHLAGSSIAVGHDEEQQQQQQQQQAQQQQNHAGRVPDTASRSSNGRHLDSTGPASRASPELGFAEIEGQVFDPTSGVTFLHRAWKRLAKHGHLNVPPDQVQHASAEQQHVMLAGDRPLPKTTEEDLYRIALPPHQDLVALMALYFDVCIATYRILHRPSVEIWLAAVEDNVRAGRPAWKDLGKSKAAIVFACLSVATAHHEKSKGIHSGEDDAISLARSDELFCFCTQLTDTETGSPSIESAQARIIQTLYLLTTSRMNRAWYTFGNALQLISALGLHRKTKRQPVDYIISQCRRRTFWVAYILDKYLGVIFGRPRHYHDEDIDQELPDRLEDEDITAQGPLAASGEGMGCHIEALIFHVKIARIIGQISREVYSIRPISEAERISAAHRLSREIHEWKSGLPAYLVSVRPSILITSFRRQSIVLKLGYCHAIMHANRLFLLATLRYESEQQISECIGAARAVFEVVDGLAYEGPIFHAFWWTQYVTFCALVVTYVWDIQLKRRGTILLGDEQAKHASLMELARRCQTHLAKATARNSPSRRYAFILEEFRSEAMGQKRVPDTLPLMESQSRQLPNGLQAEAMLDPSYYSASDGMMGAGAATDLNNPLGYSLLDEWNTTDWLELDSSAFGPYMDVDTSALWMPNMQDL